MVDGTPVVVTATAPAPLPRARVANVGGVLKRVDRRTGFSVLQQTSVRTVIGQLYGTPLADGQNALSANIGATSVLGGATTTFQHLAAARMGAPAGWRIAQPGADVMNFFVDFPDNADPIYTDTLGIRFNADQTGTAATTFDRLYPDALHGTTNISISRTSTKKLRILETGTGGLDVTSTADLATGAAYVIEKTVNSTTGVITVKVYASGSSTVAFTVSGTLLAPFVVKSRRMGNGNGGSCTSIDYNSFTSWGRGSTLPRHDLLPVTSWHGPLNTGVFGNVALTRTPASGYAPFTVTTSNQTYQNLDFYGLVSINANVTGTKFINCRFRGHSSYVAGSPTSLLNTSASGVSGTVVKDCTFVPDFVAAETVGLDCRDITASNCDFGHLQDCMRPRGNNVTIQDSWLHDLTYFLVDVSRATSGQTHNDLIQCISAVSPHFYRNYLDAHYSPRGQFAPTMLQNPSLPPINNPTGQTFIECTVLMVNVSTGGAQTTGIQFYDNVISGGYQITNTGDAAEANANVGTFYRNKVVDEPRHAGFRFTADQTADAGEGDATKQNTFLDGTPVVVTRNG